MKSHIFKVSVEEDITDCGERAKGEAPGEALG